jgi:hypothetical protein
MKLFFRLKMQSSIEFQPTPVMSEGDAPLLDYDLPSTSLVWVWHLPNPAHWIYERSADGKNNWQQVGMVDGDVRTHDVEEDWYWRVTGLNASLEPVTLPSNIVYSYV